jgi:hypothetical protein
MSAVDDLIAWLRVQLDEDERVARAAIADNDGESSWAITQPGPDEPSWRKPQLLWLNVMDSCDPESMPPGMAEHIARWDPARVLAEVEAKRQVLELYEVSKDATLSADAWIVMGYAIKAVALAYADRPGYLPEWRLSPA